MNAKTIILAALRLQSMTGYEIKKMCTEGPFSFFSDISYGSIYPTLARLEEGGLVSCNVEEQNGKPDRKVYSITPQGLEEFSRALPGLTGEDKYKSEFCLFVLCGAIIPPQLMQSALEQRLQQMRDAKACIHEAGEQYQCPFSNWLTRYGEHLKQSHVEFLERHGNELLEACKNNNHSKEAAE